MVEASLREGKAMNSNLSDVLLDKEFGTLLEKYLGSKEEPANSVSAQHEFLAEKLATDRFVLPVTGVQGCGKSTLLNALLFDEPVLPIDADETTCVPVELTWAEEPSDQAFVKYSDGRVDEVAATQESLELLVDNKKNPGNTLGVDRVVVESSSPLLQEGLVLVDLPGTGSLTRANAETTQQYLKEAVGIFFLLRTVPPLTRSESVFVAMNWSRLPLAIFAQNMWVGESKDECDEGARHNRLVLKQLAEKCHLAIDTEPEIQVVNAYNALKASLKGNQSLARDSGLDNLRNTLSGIATKWPEEVSSSVSALVDMQVNHCLTQIKDELDLIQADAKEAERQLELEQARFEEYISTATEKCEKAVSEISTFEKKSLEELRMWARDIEPSLRNSMRTKMRAGVVDGPRLERALLEEEEAALDEVFADLLERLFDLDDKLRIEFENLPDWSMSKPESSYHTVKKREKTKPENLFPKVLTAGGGAGGAIAGAKGGAALGSLLGSVVPGPGNVIGGVVGGLLGGLVGLFIGGMVGKIGKSQITASRAKAIEPEVFSAIQDFVRDSQEELRAQIQTSAAEIAGSIGTWKDKQMDDFDRERIRMVESSNADGEHRERKIVELNLDLEAIRIYANKLKEV